VIEDVDLVSQELQRQRARRAAHTAPEVEMRNKGHELLSAKASLELSDPVSVQPEGAAVWFSTPPRGTFKG